MGKYMVEVEWSGYSRGVSYYEVEAYSEEVAMEEYYNGTLIESETVRDDTEGEAVSAELKVVE